MTIIVDEGRALEARSIVNLMNGVLSSVVSAYENAGVSLPSRRYWLLSEPVADCEQVTVSLIQAYLGPPGDEASLPQNCDAIKTAVLQVQVHRCIPTVGVKGRAPSAMTIQDANEALAIDAFLLLDSARDFEQWDLGGPGLGVIATVEVANPQGGFQGVFLNLTLAIP